MFAFFEVRVRVYVFGVFLEFAMFLGLYGWFLIGCGCFLGGVCFFLGLVSVVVVFGRCVSSNLGHMPFCNFWGRCVLVLRFPLIGILVCILCSLCILYLRRIDKSFFSMFDHAFACLSSFPYSLAFDLRFACRDWFLVVVCSELSFFSLALFCCRCAFSG